MAAPNLRSVTTVAGKTAVLSLGSASQTDLLVNASASGKCLKVNTIIVSNVDGTNAADITIKYFSAASGGTGYAIASTITVPADSSVVIVGKDCPIYVEEDRRITAQASAANDLDVICSYEEIA